MTLRLPFTILFSALVYTMYGVVNFTHVADVKYLSFIADAFVAIATLGITFLFCATNKGKGTLLYFVIGFVLLFYSMFISALSEFFIQPMMVTLIVEDIYQIIGAALVLLGIAQWKEANAELQNSLEHLAVTDELTGLYNRRYFDKKMSEEFNRCKRSNNQFSILMIDIDHFKHINDTYGHQFGDDVLIEFSKKLETHVREIDMLARWGGEEFAMMIVDSDKQKSRSIANKIRGLIESLKMSTGVTDVNVTVSIGCANSLEGDSVKAIIKRADQALYKAKNNGRNMVVCDCDIEDFEYYDHEPIPLFKT